MGAGIIVALLVIGAAFWLFSAQPVAAAILYVDSGTVEVDMGRGWVAGTDGMELAEGAKIRTGEGAASVILNEGEVLHLEPGTEATLSEIGDSIRIGQALGETWNKVTRISGVTAYEVETPTTVATVRGTMFFMRAGEVAVEEGEVEVGLANAPTKRIVARSKQKATTKGDDVVVEDYAYDPRAEKFRQIYIMHLKKLREREISRHSSLVAAAKKAYGVTDEQIQQYLDDFDSGRRDVDKVYGQMPAILKKKAERAYRITKAIQQANAAANP